MLYCSVPQGSALGPVQFIAYTEDVQELFDRHYVKYHLFADEKQVYLSVQPCETAAARRRLTDCIIDPQSHSRGVHLAGFNLTHPRQN